MFPVVREPHLDAELQLLGHVHRLHVVDRLIDGLTIAISVRVSSLEYVPDLQRCDSRFILTKRRLYRRDKNGQSADTAERGKFILDRLLTSPSLIFFLYMILKLNLVACRYE